jgi:HD-GYP domain-containing protein (c-di-GMP phosphodiesterase class II)
MRRVDQPRHDGVRVVARELASVLHFVVEGRDPYTATHMSRVAWLSVKIGKKLGLPRDRIKVLEVGAELHTS